VANELDDLKELVIGQTYSKDLEFLDENDVAIGLNGSTLYFLLKESPRNSDVDAALSISIAFPDDSDSSKGKGILLIGSDQWASVSAGQYYWSMVRVVTGDSPQSVYPHSAGKVNVVKQALSAFA
jgi:hypothetical protein